MASARSKKETRMSMTIEHLVSPDEFLKLLSDFVLLSKSQLSDEECDQAEQLSDRMAGLIKTEQNTNLRSLIVATGFLLQASIEEVISKAKKNKGTKSCTMKFKETFQ